MRTSARAIRSLTTLHSKMGIDPQRMQLLRLSVKLKSKKDYVVEVAVPCLAEYDDLVSIDVDGIGSPVRLSGEWVCDSISTTMMREMTG